MPSLKQLTCSIELGSTHTKVVEYGKDYGDGHVTSYIAVPSEEVNFSLHLTSQGYIAPGLAMFVYMDGQYQCNRNRRGLKVPAKGVPDEQVEVDLRVRQKESKQADGSFLGRDWTFHGLNLVSADKVDETNDVFLDNLGTIEVIVLRCKDAPLPPPSAPVNRESSSRPASKPASKHSTAHQEQKAPSKPSSSSHKHKEPSAKAKESSKAPSKPASAKPASVKPATAKESSIGGMFGLFDGSSDEPDHHGVNPKSYWSDWNKRPTIPSSRPTRNLYLAPEEPLPLVPKQAARAKHVEHQVKTGKGAQYLHLCARPEYLDSMKQPYAVFTFRYRSKRFIEKKFKIEIKEEGKALKAKLADMSRDELAEELFRLRVSYIATQCMEKVADGKQMAKESSSTKYSKEKAPSAAKEAQVEALTNSKTPSVAKSKASKAAAAPAQTWDAPAVVGDWANPPAPNWDNTVDPKPASKTPSKAASKTPSKAASQTASQKANQAPGSYPTSESSHHTASNAAAAAASSHHTASNAAKSATKKSASKKSNKDDAVAADAAAGAEQPTADGGGAEWNQTQQDNNIWNAAPAGNDAWGGGAPAGDVKCYLLKAVTLFLILKSWILAPFAWTKRLWLSITDLRWMVAPFAWVWACIKKGLLWVLGLVEKVKIGKPKFPDFDVWRMERFKRPEWLSWPHWSFKLPGVVKDGYEVFAPDGVQAVEEVLEEL
ncbi:hypothetical protein E4T52_11958 [Aureobasidium sp. EXF-3400]|nr:hypothetical protein E4T51_10989 [Aureobasidium sp. EXF-12344]KAI4773060.1 hypothetical protein E4T52_11958 [Aureobasidium sp. EXF-3400]